MHGQAVVAGGPTPPHDRLDPIDRHHHPPALPRVPTRSVRKYTPRAQLKPLGAREPASGARETGGGGRPARLCQEGDACPGTRPRPGVTHAQVAAVESVPLREEARPFPTRTAFRTAPRRCRRPRCGWPVTTAPPRRWLGTSRATIASASRAATAARGSKGKRRSRPRRCRSR